jgi:tetratricopeptide (TPR) repeat protein
MIDELLLVVVAVVLLGFAIVRYAGDTATDGDDTPDTSDPSDDPHTAPADGGRSANSPAPPGPDRDTPDVDDLREQLESARDEERWSDAIDLLDQLTATLDDPEQTAKFAYTAAIIARDKLDNPRQAIPWFDVALDADPDKLEAFEATDQILTDLEDWKGLEKAYRRQLRRIAEQVDRPATELKTEMWKKLGQIYADRLDHPKSARQALQTASAISDDPEIDRMLEDLED